MVGNREDRLLSEGVFGTGFLKREGKDNLIKEKSNVQD